jgi:hypothetical protein
LNPPQIYLRSVAGADQFLAQGEIISNIIQTHLDYASFAGSHPIMVSKIHPFAVALSQGCDLDQDYRARQDEVNQDKRIPAVLFCEAIDAESLRARCNAGIWKRIRDNNDERYHFLQAVAMEFDADGRGLPEIGIDFKRYFTIPTDEVYYRIRCGEAKRRCYLNSPYLEHFCRRFANYLSRVALPEPHIST